MLHGTRYEDIEKELSMYPKNIWKNKTVFCNCDDAVDNNEKKYIRVCIILPTEL